MHIFINDNYLYLSALLHRWQLFMLGYSFAQIEIICAFAQMAMIRIYMHYFAQIATICACSQFCMAMIRACL